MKKLILTTIEYRYPKGQGNISRMKLVVINSSRLTNVSDDIDVATRAARAWFDKSAMAAAKAECISVTAEDTIDADNPEPQVLYTEGDLVTFGNFMAKKILRIVDYKGSTNLNSLQVWDSDIANWKEEIKNKD